MTVQAGPCIVFCASQRTGSTLVFDDLRNLMGCQPRDSERLYTRIIREKTTEPWEAVWADVMERNHMAGFTTVKVMFHYTPHISTFIAGGSVVRVPPVLAFEPDRFDAFRAFFGDAIWVHIERRDVFAQAVSMFLAQRTALWEIRPAKPGLTPAARPHVGYDGRALRAQLRSFLMEREQWHLFFDHYGIAPLRIDYEDAVERYPAYLDPLLAKAGLMPTEAAPARRMLKVGNDVNDRFADALRTEILAELYMKSVASG